MTAPVPGAADPREAAQPVSLWKLTDSVALELADSVATATTPCASSGEALLLARAYLAAHERLAAVEALCDRWESAEVVPVRAVRAALAAAPEETGEGTA